MKLFEYQAKNVFREAGIPVPESGLAQTKTEVKDVLAAIGYPAVLKSQVLTGGRGKAGLIRVVQDEAAAMDAAEALFSSPLGVNSILVEEAVNIDREIYLAITVDPVDACALVLASAEGGIEIEELAVTAPDKIIRETVDLERGLQPFQIRNIVKGLDLEGDAARGAAVVLSALWTVFRDNDAELAEINPLFLNKGGEVLAGDGKIVLDDNSEWRRSGFEAGREYFDSDAAFEAAKEGIPYLQFDGDISLMCAGAGLTTTSIRCSY